MHAPARPTLLLGTVLIVLAAGCSKDDDNNPTGTGDTNPETRTANEVVYDVMLPVVRELALTEYIRQAPPVEAGKQACVTLDFCTSGTVEVCTDIGSVDVTFTQCQLPSGTVNGTISLVGSTSSGSGIISISLGNVTIDGSISYSDDGTCFGQIFSQVQVVASNRSMVMSGGVEWCDPPFEVGGVIYPNFAQFEFVIESLGRLVDASIATEPAGDLQILVMDPTRSTIYRLCHGNVAGSTLSCTDGS